MMPSRHGRAPLFAVAALSLVASASSQDPPPPPGGFTVHVDRDIPVTYSDGYRTAMDVRHPAGVLPAPGGWPCAVVIHGGGGDRRRGWVEAQAERLAAAGYLTVAYDTGNQGITLRANPGVLRTEPERVTDLAEVFAFAERRYGPLLDASRLAVFGKSGGGKHALWAASFSGQPLLAPRAVSHMPRIAAIHTDIQVLDTPADTLPDGVMIKADWAVSALEREGPTGPTVTMMRNADYAGLAAMMAADPLTDLMPRLAQSDVPLFVSYAYDDTKHDVNVNADALARLPGGVPRRYLQITGGHASAENSVATQVRRDFTRRWFDRFLKGVPNGVDSEPFAEIAVLPSAPAEYLDPRSHWGHRQTATWPLPPTATFYLRGDRSLRPAAPAADEPDATIAHRVTPGYDMLAFMQDGARPPLVTASIPLVAEAWTGPVLAGSQEVFGRGAVEFDVTATAADFQLQAALLDVAPNGAERFVTCGVGAVRGAPVGSRQRLRIELGDVGYVVAPGHRLRLSIENQNLRRQPGNTHYFVAPDFDDVDVTVQIDAAFAPRVHLPLRAIQASLTPRIAGVRASAGLLHDVRIDATDRHAGAPYLLLMGGSGTTPGIAIPGATVPVTYDALTDAGLTLLGSAVVPGFVGFLDADGRADPRLDLPAPFAAALVGRRLTFAAVGIDATGAFFVTAPAELVVEP